VVEEILGKNKSLKTTQMRYFQGSDLVIRTGIELIPSLLVVFSKMRKWL